ncbi:hypothetical protein FRC04_002049, partial [Tulasnella sp. 424]
MTTIDFPFPFTNIEEINCSSDPALPLVDLRMIELSYALRCKNSWWIKINDPDIRSKWAEEASEQTIRGGKLNEDEIEWVLDELEDYATMRDEATGIQPSCHVRVWESDALVSKELRSKLISAAAVLENVPEDEKDWHPRSENLVLDLVHPSLFCAVYERTQRWDTVDNKKVLAPSVQRIVIYPSGRIRRGSRGSQLVSKWAMMEHRRRLWAISTTFTRKLTRIWRA